MKTQNKLELTKEELEAVFTLVKKYEDEAPENDDEAYDDYYDTYEEPITKKITLAILKKIEKILPKRDSSRISKSFLRKKYHTFNNTIDYNVYAVIEKAFESLKSIEITYFNMESAEFSKRKIDVYYKSQKYVIGYCHLRREIRKFRTSRIASAKLTNEKYKIPNNFDKDNY